MKCGAECKHSIWHMKEALYFMLAHKWNLIPLNKINVRLKKNRKGDAVIGPNINRKKWTVHWLKIWSDRHINVWVCVYKYMRKHVICTHNSSEIVYIDSRADIEHDIKQKWPIIKTIDRKILWRTRKHKWYWTTNSRSQQKYSIGMSLLKRDFHAIQ